MFVFDEEFDVVVIGSGHAGCEAASAAARLGAETALVTINLDLIGQMSCNPAIGGIAKGHLVREIDALGGIMGKVIDRTGIQFRLLNRSRGPAVQSPRAQADRALYRTEMRCVLEHTANLHLRQGMVVDLILENQRIVGVELQDTRRIRAKSVVMATGTFLNGTIHTGKRTFSAGRAGEPSSIELAEKLKHLGLPIGRLKTGTPPRLDARSIDWSAFEKQAADDEPVPFSFSTEQISQPQISCYIGYTNDTLHEEIRQNLHQSPLYSGKIKGIGPRYCPSIEDKVVKFADKTRHQLFLEPEGHHTNEVYLNGFSTSLPADLQLSLLRRIEGFENVQIIRPGYAIEYDFVDPRQLKPSMETTHVSGLFFAGQLNGTTGYEEAACQGLMAGINAALQVQGREPFRLSRNDAYIGVLIDDLLQHGVDEPYRIFTSRAESRLTLRHDNADERLSPFSKEIGLLDDEEWKRFNKRRDDISLARQALENIRFKRSDIEYSVIAESLRTTDLGDAVTLSALVTRAGVTPSFLYNFLPANVKEQVNEKTFFTAFADSLYSGYVVSQKNINERVNRYDSLKISSDFDYRSVSGLSHEMIERLERAQPETFSALRNVKGLTPAAVSLLLVCLSSNTAKSVSA